MYSPLVVLSQDGICPARGSDNAAGWDLFSSEAQTIDPGKRLLCGTGLRMKIPIGNYGRIAPRSGLALKHGIDVGAGVVDADYRGEIKVLLFNHSEEPFEVKKGSKIAQIIFEQINTAPILISTSLNDTARGDGGFGSTDNQIRTSPITIDGF